MVEPQEVHPQANGPVRPVAQNDLGTHQIVHAVFFVLACALPWSQAYFNLQNTVGGWDFFDFAQNTGRILAAAAAWAVLSLFCARVVAHLRPGFEVRFLARVKFFYLALPAVALVATRWIGKVPANVLLQASLGFVLLGSVAAYGEWRRTSASLSSARQRLAMILPVTDRGRSRLSILVLLGFVLIFFHPVFTQRRIISPEGFMYVWPPFSGYALGQDVDYNTITSDFADALFPQYHLLYNAVHDFHEFPLTNIYQLANDSHATLLASHFFSIDGLLCLLLGVPWGMTIAVLLRFWLGAVFCYLFLREVGAGHLSGILAGVVFSFSIYSVVFAWLPLFFTFPMVLYASERILRRPGYIVSFLLIAANVAVLCGGQIVWSIHIITTQILYVAFRLITLQAEPREKMKGFALIVSAGLASLSLLAFLILPSFEQYRALDLGYRSGNSTNYHSHGFSLMFLFPEVSGPLNAPFQWGGNTVEYGFYIGLIPIVLFLLVTGRKMGRQAVFFVGITLFIYAIITNAFDILQVVRLVPFYDSSSNTRLRYMWSFTIAVAAALGFDRVLRNGPRDRWLILKILIVAGGVFTAGMWVLSAFDHLPFLVQFEDPAIQRHLTSQIVLLCVGVAVLVAAYTAVVREPYAVLLICLVFVDVYTTHASYNTFIEPNLSFPKMRMTDFLKENTQDGSRILPIDRAFISNFALPYGIATIQPRGFYTIRQRQFFQLIDADALANHPTMAFFSWNLLKYPSPLIDLLDVKYLLFMNGQVEDSFYDGLGDDWKPVYRDELTVLENRGGYRGAFRVTEAEVLASEARVLNRLREIDPRRVVLLEDPTAEWPPADRSDSEMAAGRLDLVELHQNKLVYEADGPGRAYGVFSRFYHPAWKAYVDGVPVPTYTADYVLIAIRLPEGHHRVELRFEPANLALGLRVSGATALLLLAIALYGARRALPGRRATPAVAVASPRPTASV